MHFISSTWLLLILLIPKEAERLCLGFFYRSSSCLFRLSALVCIVISYFLPPSCVLKKVWRKNILLFSTKIDALKGYSNNAVSLLYCHLSHKDFETEMHTFFFSSFFFLCFFCVFVSATHYLHGHAMSESKYPCASGATPKVWSIIKDISKRHAKSVITSSRWSFDFTKCFRSLNSTHNDE